MKLPLSWIQEYIDLTQPPEQIAKLLTAAGLEVDGIESTVINFTGVVVGRVIDVEKHPNANKLCLATVSDGARTFQVVCGAPNCRTGIKTAFAPVGATLCDQEGRIFNIKPATIRGVESFGMLCSAGELNLPGEGEGIMEFDASVEEGKMVSDLYAETIFEISLTPNLGHCASVIGVVRELSAVTGIPMRSPVVSLEEEAVPIADYVNVTVQDFKKCPRYACRFIQNVIVAPSPDWMQKRLLACGIRPINNVVDAANYVTLEMGHPLHAFDYDQLEEHKIVVKCAQDHDLFMTLDNKERILSKEDLLICDGKKPVALAGVMGGLNSEVSDDTRKILLEAAYFHPGTIRKTSKRLGLQTDASKRFERGTDPNLVEKVLNRAAALIASLTGGKIASGIIDVKECAFPEKVIACRFSRINSILGTRLSLSEVENIWQRLQFHYSWDGQDAFLVTIPTFRVDVAAEIDLIEEVARIYGYENISKAGTRYQASQLPHSPIFLFEREVRTRMIAEGLQEFLTCDLIGPSILNIIKESLSSEEAMVKVVNPTSIEQSILRTSLLPGLLQLVKYNVDHQNHHVNGFEVGRVHFREGDHYKEQSVLGIVLVGKNAPHHWDEKPDDVDFFELKGLIENLLMGLRVEGVSYRSNTFPTFHSGRQASIYVDALEVGSLGEVHPAIVRRLDISQRIFFAEIDLHDLIRVRKEQQKMVPLPIYPCSERDWTITLREEIAVQDVLNLMHRVAEKRTPSLLEEVALLDIYRSESIGSGLKNVTFHFVYRDQAKTIEQEDVEAEHQRILKEVTQTLEQL